MAKHQTPPPHHGKGSPKKSNAAMHGLKLALSVPQDQPGVVPVAPVSKRIPQTMDPTRELRDALKAKNAMALAQQVVGNEQL